MIRARAGLVRARTALVNTARGLAKSYGERLRGCNRAQYGSGKSGRAESGTAGRVAAAAGGVEALSEQIRECNERIEKLAGESYPQVALLKQIKGVGTLIALTFLLTLEDAHRFRKSRDVGCYLGLQPGRRNSGQSEPQMHISKEGDPYLRTLLVQGAQHILGPFGVDSDLRRWGLKLAERGGKSGKKRAIIATARKLAVLLHHLWVSGEVYEPLHNSQHEDDGSVDITKTFHEEKSQKPRCRVPVTALIAWPTSVMRWKRGRQIRWQHRLKREHPTCTERNQIAHRRVRMEGWRQ